MESGSYSLLLQAGFLTDYKDAWKTLIRRAEDMKVEGHQCFPHVLSALGKYFRQVDLVYPLTSVVALS